MPRRSLCRASTLLKEYDLRRRGALDGANGKSSQPQCPLQLLATPNFEFGDAGCPGTILEIRSVAAWLYYSLEVGFGTSTGDFMSQSSLVLFTVRGVQVQYRGDEKI